MVDYSNIPRDSRRVPLETRVQFKFDRFDGFISEYSANISPGGLFLRTRVPQPPGTVLDFEFRLGDGFELIRGRGEVVWNRLEDEGAARPAGMGLRFQSLSEGSKELIYRIVDQHILHGGTPFDVTQHPPDPIPLPPPPAPPPPSATAAPLPPPPPTGTAVLAAPAGTGATPWPRPAPPPAAREVFDLSPPLSTPDASSWLPALNDGGPGGPGGTRKVPQMPPPEGTAPAEAPPMFASTFGTAAARPPRRKLPFLLLAAGVLVAAALFLLRDRVMGWVGLGGGDEVIAQATPPTPSTPRRAKGARRARPGAPVTAPAASAAPGTTATSDLATSDAPAAAPAGAQASPAPAVKTPPAAPPTKAPPATAAPPAAAPSPVKPAKPADTPPAPPAAKTPAKAAPFPAVPEDTGAPLTAVEKITFEAAGGGTDVIISGNGSIPASVYVQSRIEGNPPRELFRLSGIRQPFAKARIVAGTPELLQIRTGAHGNELHVVLDLAHPNVVVTQVEPGPQRLRIHLQRK